MKQLKEDGIPKPKAEEEKENRILVDDQEPRTEQTSKDIVNHFLRTAEVTCGYE